MKRMILILVALQAGHAMAQYTADPLHVLPVKFEILAASRTDGVVTLKWQTITDLNASQFIVERSADGFSFTPIGQVNATGKSNTATLYFFTDKQPMRLLNYYRIKTVNSNATVEYSYIILVDKIRYSANITAFPNPVTRRLTVSGMQPGAEHTLWLSDAGGRVISRQVTANTEATVNMDGLMAGTYFLRIKTRGDDYTRQVMKQ